MFSLKLKVNYQLEVDILGDESVNSITNTITNSLAKEFSKILTFEYFRYFGIGLDVFFDADSESPRMT